MIRNFSLLAFIVLFFALAAPPHVHGEGLNEKFIGDWRGVIQRSVMGPFQDTFNLTIRRLTNTTNPTYLLSDIFDVYLAHGSIQNFWIEFNEDSSFSTLTYRGSLRNFFADMKTAIVVVFNQVKHTETYLEYLVEPSPPPGYRFRARWILELLEDGNKLHSKLLIPDPSIVHMECIFERVRDEGRYPAVVQNPHVQVEGAFDRELEAKLEKAKKEKRAAEEAAKLQAFPHENDGDHTREHDPVITGATTSIGATDDAAAESKSGCPFGFGRKNVAPPVSYLGHEHCYLINPALNVTVRYTWNTSTSSIDVLYSGTVPESLDLSKTYLALGLMANNPTMENMDIVLAYLTHENGIPTSCIRSMYAEKPVGTPVENPSQDLSDASIRVEGRTMYVAFTRPWNTGHHDISKPHKKISVIPSISWAFGEAGPTCTSTPKNHFALRGMYGWWWAEPTKALPDWMKCN